MEEGLPFCEWQWGSEGWHILSCLVIQGWAWHFDTHNLNLHYNPMTYVVSVIISVFIITEIEA